MKIKPEQVERTAELARLDFSTDELNRFVDQFSELLGYFEQLQEVDIGSAEPLYHPLPRQDTPYREDRAKVELSSEEALREAPESAQGHFKVPRVIES